MIGDNIDMTRINLVPVEELCNQHLFAEYREMPRMISYLERSLASGKPLNIPNTFCLGTGHVKFFYDKFMFLHLRHITIVDELLLNRDYNLTNISSNIFQCVPNIYYNNWTPTDKDIAISRARIQEKLPKNPRYGKRRYY